MISAYFGRMMSASTETPAQVTQATEYFNIPISQIRENPVALRAVDREGEPFLNLVKDVKRRGVLQPVTVRQKIDPVSEETFYELCDGLHRFTASVDAGLSVIPCKLLSIDDSKVYETQIVANLCRVDTKPIEFADQLRRMTAMNPTLTEQDLADMISQSKEYVEARLGLHKLADSIKPIVNEGGINVANAIQLSKLPHKEQLDLVDMAHTMKTGEFAQVVKTRKSELAKAAREGREANPIKFEPRPHLRKPSEFKLSEADIKTLVTANSLDTPEAAVAFTLNWAQHLDPASVNQQETEWNDRIKARADAKAKRKAVQDSVKAQQAAANAAKALEESGLSPEELEDLIKKQQQAEEAAKVPAEEAVETEAVAA
ncbi:MAG: ParB/RepB/Spo0J family partition protein [Candidatus Competibacteraceae bacterium]|nr:ParB/RepB/Spo0J family partition protein [Candidatus Competibacteraceae bacterium]